MSKNLLKLTGACVALTAAAAMPLQAAAQDSNQVIARDAATGKLRAATAEEMAGLEQIKADKARMFRVAPKRNMSRIHVSGGRGARLTDESLSSSVAIKHADGTVEQECFDSAAEAQAALAAGALTHSHANVKLDLE